MPDPSAPSASPEIPRYLLVRPLGGMNDTLVQLEKARGYAARHGRQLLVDLSLSGLRVAFSRLFVPRSDFGCPVRDATPETLAACGLTNDPALDLPVGTHSFDFAIDHPDALLVYQECGGNMTSLRFLRHVAFAPDVAEAVAGRVLGIGDRYVALHVRHSDYRTDFEAFFAIVRPLVARQRLLVCCDNAMVQRRAREVFGPVGAKVVTLADLPDLAGLPLHQADGIDGWAHAVDAFADLAAMGFARRLLFTALSRQNDLGFYFPFSGFVTLALCLRAEPETLIALFDNTALSGDLRALHQRNGARRALHRVRHPLAELRLASWNRLADKRVRHVRRTLARGGI